jgi:hypothetical protein
MVSGSGFKVYTSVQRGTLILQPGTLNGEPLNRYRFNLSNLNVEQGTFEPIPLQSFKPERGTGNL